MPPERTAAVAGLAARGYEFDSARFQQIEAARKALQVQTEALQAARNSTSKQIGQLKGQGKHAEPKWPWPKWRKIKDRLEQTEAEYQAVQAELDEWLLGIPQPTARKRAGGQDDCIRSKCAKWAHRAHSISK